MQGEAAALAAIRAEFVDPEPATYIQSWGALPPLAVVRLETSAPSYEGPGRTLRTITYQILQADLPEEPTKRDKLIHRGRQWAIDDVTRRDDIGEWDLIVSDAGRIE